MINRCSRRPLARTNDARTGRLLLRTDEDGMPGVQHVGQPAAVANFCSN